MLLPEITLRDPAQLPDHYLRPELLTISAAYTPLPFSMNLPSVVPHYLSRMEKFRMRMKV